MKLRKISIVFIVLIFAGYASAEEKNKEPRGIAYPEKKYYEESYKAVKTQEEILNELYMKTPKIEEGVDLKSIEEIYFLKGTKDKEPEEYLKEAEKERWEEWSPFFYEFGKVLKEQGKEVFRELLLFPQKTNSIEER